MWRSPRFDLSRLLLVTYISDVNCISNKLEFVISTDDKLFLAQIERKIKYFFQKANYDLKENFRMVIGKYGIFIT